MAEGLHSGLWRSARERALRRDNHRCAVVERYGPDEVRCPATRDLAVHHLVRPEDGGRPYALANLLTVCRKHHLRAHLVVPELVRARTRRRRGRANASAYAPFRRAA